LAYHFVDKEGLYATVVQRLHEDLATGWPTGVTPKPERDLAHAWVEAGWTFAREHRPHIRLLLRHVLDRGGHHEAVVDHWMEPLLGRAEAIMGLFRPEWSSTQRRLMILTLQHLVVRFVLEDPAQLARQMALPDGEDGDATVVDWFAHLLRTQLGLPTPA
jgi:AcrR family transcriptional regulator